MFCVCVCGVCLCAVCCALCAFAFAFSFTFSVAFSFTFYAVLFFSFSFVSVFAYGDCWLCGVCLCAVCWTIFVFVFVFTFLFTLVLLLLVWCGAAGSTPKGRAKEGAKARTKTGKRCSSFTVNIVTKPMKKKWFKFVDEDREANGLKKLTKKEKSTKFTYSFVR